MDPHFDCCHIVTILLPPANEVWGKVMFLHLSVILFLGGLCPSMHHRSHDQGVSVQGVSIQEGLCPGGSLSREGMGLCPGRGWVSVQGGLLPANKVWGKGNVFTPVCDSVHGGGSLHHKLHDQGGLCPGRGWVSVQGGGGSLSTEGASLCSGRGWVSAQGGLCLGPLSRGSLSRGISVQGDLCQGDPPIWCYQ